MAITKDCCPPLDVFPHNIFHNIVRFILDIVYHRDLSSSTDHPEDPPDLLWVATNLTPPLSSDLALIDFDRPRHHKVWQYLVFEVPTASLAEDPIVPGDTAS